MKTGTIPHVTRPSLLALAPKGLFTSFFTTSQQARLSRNFEWELSSIPDLNSTLRQQLATIDGLITTWDSPSFGEDLVEIAPRLRIIAHCGGEVKKRFAGSLLDRLTVTTAPEPMGRATAELAATLLLYCGRGIDRYRAELRKPSNQIYEHVHLFGTPESLIGREVGMLGFGRIGRKMVDLLRGFDLRWRVYDPYAARDLVEEYPVEFVSLESLLKASDLLVLVAALTDETRGILDQRTLAFLPDGATIINVARGNLMDLEALTREVEKGRLHCALDVSDPVEPLPQEHPLRNIAGAIVTPHVGGGTERARREMADDLIDDLERFFRGESVKNRVTTDMLARMT